MNTHDFQLAGLMLSALPSGALWVASAGALVVSDLHLGKAERMARRGGGLLPPYEVTDTLTRLDSLIGAFDPAIVICLGDSFDDLAAAEAVAEAISGWLARMQAGRRWVWIEGNHDPGPVTLGGAHLASLTLDGLSFRHIATRDARAEISGHYHPKARLSARGRGISRPCFLIDETRAILPAFGTYTGGLDCRDPALAGLMGPGARALLTGPQITEIPMPRQAAS